MVLSRQQDSGGVRTEPPAPDGGRDDRQARAVVEDGLHVHLGDHVRDAGQDVVRAEHAPGALDGLREARSVAGRLAHGVRVSAVASGTFSLSPRARRARATSAPNSSRRPRRGSQSHAATPPPLPII
ncbi:hypothetical protein STANM309S_05795 [Streptomyces tanashiensis]